jgi:ureidoglycolate hydrolase
MDESLVEIREYKGAGFQPLIHFGDWRVAILRWEQGLQPQKIEHMERHTQTDEVFVLLEGQATLILGGKDAIVNGAYPYVMECGKLYNVKQDVWHTILLSRDASILIVEDRDTGKENTEFCDLTGDFREEIVNLSRGGM